MIIRTLMDRMSSSSSSTDDFKLQDSNRRHAGAKEKSKRPQLSCKNCRLRKVKCDRVQPCSACAFHQSADECEYELPEEERRPILQAEKIRLQEKEITRLRSELAASTAQRAFAPQYTNGRHNKHHLPLRLFSQNPPTTLNGMPDIQSTPADELSSINREFLDLEIRPKAPYEQMIDFPPSDDPASMMGAHPFPALWPVHSGTRALLSILPSSLSEVYDYLDSFEEIAVKFAFPYLPLACTKQNISHFMAQLERNAESNPEVLALILSTICQAIFYGSSHRFGEEFTPDKMLRETKKADLFLAGAFQALRLSSFMNKPNLVAIEALTMMIQYLCDSGRLIDAWSLVGLTVRLATWAKIHRDPAFAYGEVHRLDSTRRASIWWWLLHTDCLLSMTCGRPLAASKIGDCPPTELKSCNALNDGQEGFRLRLTVICRSVLEKSTLDQSSIPTITQDLVELSQVNFPDSLLEDSDGFVDNSMLVWPSISQRVSNHMFIHSLIILINQQRQVGTATTSEQNSEQHRSYERVLESCRVILRLFEFMRLRIRPTLLTWTNCQAAFNGAMVLSRSLRATSQPRDLQLVRQAYKCFQEINDLKIHSLAGSAASQIEETCQAIQKGDAISEEVLSKQGMALIEGAALRDSILSYNDVFTGDSSSCLLPTLDNSAVTQTFTAVLSSNHGKPGRKLRTAQPTSSSSGTKVSGKRISKKDKEYSKSRSSFHRPSSDPSTRQQSGRPWSVGKKQHQSSSRTPQSQPKRSRMNGSGGVQYPSMTTNQVGTSQVQYFPSDILESFPSPPSSSQLQQEENRKWDAETNHLLTTTQPNSVHMQALSLPLNDGGISNIAGGEHQDIERNIPATIPLNNGGVAGSIQHRHPTQRRQQQRQKQSRTSQAQTQQQQQQQQGPVAANIATQHVFASSSNDVFAQPQSPALWGLQFNPLLDQGYTANPGEPEQQGGQQQNQEQQAVQQAMFPGGMSDPNCFWGYDDTPHWWGG